MDPIAISFAPSGDPQGLADAFKHSGPNRANIVLTAVLSAACLAGQSEVEEGALALVQRSINACDRVRSVAYTASTSMDMRDGRTTTSSGRVRFVRDAGDTLLGAKIRIELTSGRENVIVYSRGTQTHLLPGLSRAILSRRGAIGLIGGRIYYADVMDPNLLPKWNATIRPTLEDLVAKASSLHIADPSVVGGVPCDVVQYEMPEDWRKMTYRGEVLIGKQDSLPRKVIFLAKPRTGEAGGTTFTVTDLKLNPEHPANSFTVEIPDAYEVIEEDDELPPVPKRFVDVGDVAPRWELVDAEGNMQALDDLAGKVVVVDFWGTWCAPCVEAMPRIQELHDRFKDSGVVVIGISCREKPDADAATFMRKRGFDYGLLVDGDRVAEAYGIPAFPTLLVIGRHQRIAFRTVGFGTDDLNEIVGIIERELAR